MSVLVRQRHARTTAIVGLTMVCGCSFATMRSPHGTPPQCEESRSSPTLDTLATIAAPLVAYEILVLNNSNPPRFGEQPSFEIVASLVITTPVMAVTGASAIFGFIKADRCERAKRDYQQQMTAPAVPGPYAPPPVMPAPGGDPSPQVPPPVPPPPVPPGPPPSPPPP